MFELDNNNNRAKYCKLTLCLEINFLKHKNYDFLQREKLLINKCLNINSEIYAIRYQN